MHKFKKIRLRRNRFPVHIQNPFPFRCALTFLMTLNKVMIRADWTESGKNGVLTYNVHRRGQGKRAFGQGKVREKSGNLPS